MIPVCLAVQVAAPDRGICYCHDRVVGSASRACSTRQARGRWHGFWRWSGAGLVHLVHVRRAGAGGDALSTAENHVYPSTACLPKPHQSVSSIVGSVRLPPGPSRAPHSDIRHSGELVVLLDEILEPSCPVQVRDEPPCRNQSVIWYLFFFSFAVPLVLHTLSHAASLPAQVQGTVHPGT